MTTVDYASLRLAIVTPALLMPPSYMFNDSSMLVNNELRLPEEAFA